MSVTTVELKIKELESGFNASETKIAQFMRESSDKLLQLSIAQAADSAGVSSAAIVRFCKRLGFDGLKDLKTVLADELMESVKDAEIPKADNRYTDTAGLKTSEQVISAITASHIKAMEETSMLLDKRAFEEAVSNILMAKRVDFFGVGASGLVALDAQQKFARIGVYSLAYTDSHLQITAAATMRPGDIGVFISYSGRTKDILESLKVAKDVGAKTIAITQFKPSKLSESADIVLHVCSHEITVRSGAMSSRIAQLAMIDMIFTAFVGSRHDELLELLSRSYEYMGVKKVR